MADYPPQSFSGRGSKNYRVSAGSGASADTDIANYTSPVVAYSSSNATNVTIEQTTSGSNIGSCTPSGHSSCRAGHQWNAGAKDLGFEVTKLVVRTSFSASQGSNQSDWRLKIHDSSGTTIDEARTSDSSAQLEGGGTWNGSQQWVETNGLSRSWTLDEGSKFGVYATTGNNSSATIFTSSSNVSDNENAGTFTSGLVFTADTDKDAMYKLVGTCSPLTTVNGATGSIWKSTSETNPNLYVDMGSDVTVNDIAIYPHSDNTVDTIGLETAEDNVSNEFDMSSSSGWSNTGTTGSHANNIDINSTESGKLYYDVDATSGLDQLYYYDLGSGNVSDTNWVLRFEIRPDQWDSSSQCYFVLASGTGGSATSSVDTIGMSVLRASNGTRYFRLLSNDGSYALYASLVSSSLSDSALNNAVTFFVEIKRTSSSEATMTVRTGSHSGTQIGTTQTIDPSDATGLRYLKVMNLNASGWGGTSTGTIDNVKFYNGTTSADPTFTEQSEISGLTASEWNFKNISAGTTARYVRINGKDSGAKVLAISDVKVKTI